MIETMKRRRRWPWFVLAAVLLLIGGSIAWQFRPLNTTERRLVGTWGGSNDQFIFAADRTYDWRRIGGKASPTGRGDWRISDGQLVLKCRVDRPVRLDMLKWIVQDRLFPELSVSPFVFDDPDSIRIDDEEYFRREAPWKEVSGFDGRSLASP